MVQIFHLLITFTGNLLTKCRARFEGYWQQSREGLTWIQVSNIIFWINPGISLIIYYIIARNPPVACTEKSHQENLECVGNFVNCSLNCSTADKKQTQVLSSCSVVWPKCNSLNWLPGESDWLHLGYAAVM